MIHYTADELAKLFTPVEIINIIENGIKKHARKEYLVPQRMHIHRGKSTNLIMPAFGQKYYCTKLISVDPNNGAYNLPAISGLLVLNDSTTGQTLATMDAPMITALRTAAVGSIGIKHIVPGSIQKLGIIGLGVQGYWQTIFAASIRDITEIYCYSRSSSKLKNYAEAVRTKFPHVKIIWCDKPENVVQQSELIIGCTTSKNPVFNASGIDLTCKRFISVGSFARDMQELPDEVYSQADALIMDAQSALTEVGDVVNTVENELIEPSNIHTLAEISIGKKAVSPLENLVFKSVGMAAFDLALAEAVYTQFNG